MMDSQILFRYLKYLPFTSDQDRSVWLAALITVLGRDHIPGPVPLFLSVGSDQAIDTIAMIATVGPGMSKAPQAIQNPHNEQETNAQFYFANRMGYPCAKFVNPCEYTLGSDELNQLLTADLIRSRSSGSGIANKTVWFALQSRLNFTPGPVGKDTMRRCLWMRFAATEPIPQIQPLSEVLPLVGVLDQIEIWISDRLHETLPIELGQVGQKPWASFEVWSQIVRPIVIRCGLPDPILGRVQDPVDGVSDPGLTQ